VEFEKPRITEENQVICETLYLSVDPYMRFSIMEEGYFKSFQKNKPIFGAGIGRVIESSNPNFVKNDILFTYNELDWPGQEFVLFEGEKLNNKRKLDFDLDPKQLSLLIGCLGLPGLTAYFGLEKVAQPKEGNTILISGAAGAVGSIVGQLAKLRYKCNVLGITSTEEKAQYLTKELGFDHVFVHANKANKTLCSEIKEKFPDGVDIYFDDVGGSISCAAYDCLKVNGKVVICGQISRYHDANILKTMEDIPEECRDIVKNKKIFKQHFVVSDYKNEYDQAFKNLWNYVKKGELKYRETVNDGIDRWAESFLSLFEGSHLGKLMVRIKPS